MWTDETIRAFDDLEGGSETAMREYLALIILRIQALIEQVRNPLSPDLRSKIITVITIDVHERDVIEEFVIKKIQDQSMFIWVRQLRFYMEYNRLRMKRESAFQKFVIGKHITTTSTLVTVVDSLLPLLLIDAILPLLRPSTYQWELLLRDLLELVRLKLPKILEELLVFKSLYSTAQIK
jgi:hypothetical protein